MPLAEIAAALTSLKTAGEMAKAMKDVHDATTIQGKVFELQRVILEAQGQAMEAREAQTALLDRTRDLEAEIARLKAWEGEKQNYELKAVDIGAVAYMLKSDARGTIPPHWLCPNCYQEGKKSIFQIQGRSQGLNRQLFACPACKGSFAAHFGTEPHWID